MSLKKYRSSLLVGGIIIMVFSVIGVAKASHSWGNYHWARQANPFTLKLGDNVSSAWDAHLATASADWSQSSVLDTTVVPGTKTPKTCRPTTGRVEVCNSKYGSNGWLGIASIWASGDHITQGTVKVNDTYFSTPNYNTPAWRQFVMCQEVGHTFGLDHQDVTFGNPNLGSCMDYTSDPDGPPSNEHPNQHDYDQLEAIYAHLDPSTTLKNKAFGAADQETGKNGVDGTEFGEPLKHDDKGRTSLFEKDHGNGVKEFTFVFWAN